jgi:hypothetical protein
MNRKADMRKDGLSNYSLIHFWIQNISVGNMPSADRRKGHLKTLLIYFLFLNCSLVSQTPNKKVSFMRKMRKVQTSPLLVPSIHASLSLLACSLENTAEINSPFLP